MLAFLFGGDATVPTISSAPAGWTLLETQAITSRITGYCYYKLAGASEGSDYTWTWAGSGAHKTGIIMRITGAENTNPIDAHASSTAENFANPAFAGVTPVITDDLLVMAIVSASTDEAVAGFNIVTSNPSWTTLWQENTVGVTSVSPSNGTLGVAYAIRPQVTATGNFGVTGLDAAADSVGILIAVRRETTFNTTQIDTVTLTDNLVNMKTARRLTITDAVTVTDSLVGALARVWNNVSKTVSSWFNQPK
jgi:hypothetical protein